jgi:hypothetical protein
MYSLIVIIYVQFDLKIPKGIKCLGNTFILSTVQNEYQRMGKSSDGLVGRSSGNESGNGNAGIFEDCPGFGYVWGQCALVKMLK